MIKVTLKDIAGKAGVSVSAVSLALGDKGSISSDQRERIKKIARDLGYVPNPLLSSLASKRFRSGDYVLGTPIALLELSSSEKIKRNLYREGILKTAARLGYQVRLIRESEMGNYSDLSQTLYRSGNQGVIITGQPSPAFFEGHGGWQPFSLVQCGRFRNSAPLHTVRSDIFRSVKLMYEKLFEKGYRRIGFALGRHPEILEDDEARIGAALGIVQLHSPPKNRIPPHVEQIKDRDAFLKWVRRVKPDVVAGFGAMQYYWLLESGYDVPGQIGFASMHLHQIREKGEPNYSGLMQNTGTIAEQSVILLDQLIRHHIHGFPDLPQHTLIPSSWVDGETLLSIPGR